MFAGARVPSVRCGCVQRQHVLGRLEAECHLRSRQRPRSQHPDYRRAASDVDGPQGQSHAFMMKYFLTSFFPCFMHICIQKVNFFVDTAV